MIALATLCALAVLAEPVSTSTLTVTLTPTVADEMAETVVVDGNHVLSAQVYRALVNLPENARLGPRTAARAERDIVRFLELAGYELAEVKVTVAGKQLLVHVDEGRLERIVFLGSTGLGTLRLQLMLDLPGRVFNRPDLELQLDRFRREEGVRITEYQVIAIESSTTSRGQVPSELGGVALMPTAGRYELHILMDEPDYPSGLGLELRGEPADGVVSAVRYRFSEVIVDNDRVEVAGVLGFRPQKVFGGDDGQRWVSKAGARAAWVSPELPGMPLRFLLRGEGHWGSRARSDLSIRRYDRVDAIASARFRLRPSRFVELEAGGGALMGMITSVSADGGLLPDETPRVQPTAFLHGELSLGDDDVRLDRRHEIDIDLTQVFGDAARAHVNMSYLKSFGLGFDDLVFSAAGAFVLGERPYYALERIGDHVKGAYGDSLYGWAVGAAGGEYRLSLSRELLKIGFAYDASVFARDLGNRVTEPGFVQALSVGMHALILDSFRFSLYAVAAWAIGETPQPGASISLSQVF